MKLNESSSFYERLEFAEAAKIKMEYSNLGFEINENYQIPSVSRQLTCDLFLENKETGEKIVFEIKAKRGEGNKIQTESLVQRRKEIKKALPGVKFFVRVIEEPKKPE